MGTECIGTPAAMWRVNGDVDPFGNTYDCQMSELTMGDIDTATLAIMIGIYAGVDRSNTDAFLKQLSYIYAGKDRLRWLSRRLHEHETETVRECNNVQRSNLPYGTFGDDAMAFTLAVDGNNTENGYDVCKAAEKRLKWLSSKLEKYDVQC